jgi:hypothetical protein
LGAPESYPFDRLNSWTAMDHDGIRFYSGKATYSKKFTLDKESLSENAEAYLVFENIQEMARVIVNGNDCGIVWLPPYKTRITPCLRSGTNEISVQVINTWNNRIVGDLRNPDKEPFTRTNAKVRFNKDSPLLESGLMGKAQIFFLH